MPEPGPTEAAPAADGAPGPPEPHGTAPRPTPSRPAWATALTHPPVWALAGLAALPLAVTVVALVGRHWIAGGDQAVEILRMRDVGTAHTPLTGAYSRFGWQHPGPLLFWVGAPASRLGVDTGVLATVGIIHVAAIVGAVRAAARIGGRSFAVVAAAGALWMTHSAGLTTMLDPWNPWVGMMALFAFVLSTWAAAEGDHWSPIVAVLAGSYAVQSHVGCAPLVLASSGAAVAWWCFRRRSDDRPRIGWWWLGAAAGVFAVLWALPLYQEITGHPGNLSALFDFFRTSHAQEPTIHKSLAIAARELGLPAAWMGASESDGIGFLAVGQIWTLAVSVGALVVAGLVSVRRRDRVPAALAGYSLVLLAASVFALTRTTGGFFPYVVRWTWPVAALGWGVVLWSAWRAVAAADSARVRLPVAPAAVAALAAAGLAIVVGAWPVRLPQASDSRAITALDQQVRHAVPRGRYDLAWDDPRTFGAVSIGLGVRLRHQGYDVDFPAVSVTEFGSWRVTALRSRRPVLMTKGSLAADGWTPPRGARLVARYDPLSPAERREAERLVRLVQSESHLPATNMIDATSPFQRKIFEEDGARKADVDELHRLEEPGDGYRVWLLPPPTDG